MRIDDADYECLKATLAQYHPGVLGEGDIEDFVAEGTVVSALLFAGLFCPPFTELHGMVLQCFQWPTTRRKLEDDVLSKLNRGVSRKEIEEEYNFVDVWRLFRVDQPVVYIQDEAIFAKFLAASWEAWLSHRYPKRRFSVRLLSPEEADEEGMGIVFYEER